LNNSIGANRTSLGKVIEGDEWMMRMKYKIDDLVLLNEKDTPVAPYSKKLPTDAIIAQYSINEDGSYKIEREIIEFSEVEEAFANKYSPNDIDEDGNIL
jgi:hypothetical protein